jgi:hypothetical protein
VLLVKPLDTLYHFDHLCKTLSIKALVPKSTHSTITDTWTHT